MKLKVKDGITKKLQRFTRKMPGTARDFLRVTSELWKTSTQHKLSGSTTGKYPAKRTGKLQSAVNRDGPRIESVGPLHRAYLEVDTLYAEIQEDGGRAGRYHSAVIPPRPYARPSLNQVWAKMIKRVDRFFMESWNK